MTESPTPDRRERGGGPGGRLTAGIILMMLGVLLALGMTDMFHPFQIDLWSFWPAIPIVVGIAFVAAAQSQRDRHRGYLLVTVGIWMLLTTLHVWDLQWRNSWPVLLIMLGLLHLVVPRSKDGRSPAFWLLVVGIWGLVATRRLWDLDYGTAWPLFLIAVGAYMIWGGLKDREKLVEITTSTEISEGDEDEQK